MTEEKRIWWIWQNSIVTGEIAINKENRDSLERILTTKGINYIDVMNGSVYNSLNLKTIDEDLLHLLFKYGLKIEYLSDYNEIEYLVPYFTKFDDIRHVRIFRILILHDHKGIYARIRHIDILKLSKIEITRINFFEDDMKYISFFDFLRTYCQLRLLSSRILHNNAFAVKMVLNIISDHENRHLTLFEHMWKKTKNIQF